MPYSLDKYEYCCRRLNKKTTHFLHRGWGRSVEVLLGTFLNKVRFYTNLKVLALENQYICGDVVSRITFKSLNAALCIFDPLYVKYNTFKYYYLDTFYKN